MTKTIRKTYPRDFSVGILVIIFGLVFFLSGQLFGKIEGDWAGIPSIYVAEFLVSTAVLLMVLILWEEILFPIKIRPEDNGLVFKNHKSKLVIQGIIYLCIPILVVFLYLRFEVSAFRFFSWAAVVIGLPIAGKLISGINNYHDFLKLTPDTISFKDNEHEGNYAVAQLSEIKLQRDEADDIQAIELHLSSGKPVIIEVHQMELDDFLPSIEAYIKSTYGSLLK